MTEENQDTAKFTQEDVDKIVADRVKREQNKFSDYDELKNQVNELSKYKEELEKQKQTEAERQVQEAVSQKEQELKEHYGTKLQEIEAEKITTEVLANEKEPLPSAYKQMVKKSNDPEEVKNSYQEVLKQFKEDMKQMGIDKDVGGPSNPKNTHTTKKFEELSYEEKKELYQKDPEAYRKLKDSASS